MSQTRVLFVLPSMAGGGAQRAVAHLLEHLDRKRFQPLLALLVYQGPFLRSIPDDVPVIHQLEGQFSLRRLPILVRRIKSIIGEYNVNVINTHLTPVNRIIMRAALLGGFGRRVIVTEQNNLQAWLSAQFGFVGLRLRMQESSFLYRRARHVIAVSHGAKRILTEDLHLTADHVSVVHNPIDAVQIEDALKHRVADPDWHQSEPLIVSAGRLVVQKAYDVLIRAFATVRRHRPCKLLILGEGPLRGELEGLAASLGVDQDVHLPGFVQNPWGLLVHGDIFVLSSNWEGFGNVIVEATVCGLPGISTDCPYGPSEVIEPQRSGILIPVGDVDAMAHQINRLLDDESTRRKVAQMGGHRARRFTGTAAVEKYTAIFERFTA